MICRQSLPVCQQILNLRLLATVAHHYHSTTFARRRNGQNALYGAIDMLQSENRRLACENTRLRRRVSELEGLLATRALQLNEALQTRVRELILEVKNRQAHLEEEIRENQECNTNYTLLVREKSALRSRIAILEVLLYITSN
ncbi:9372_t:CDS:2 [Ambispora leptoticha]|uniref:9372_t:CDS:1 n=1 Tax=Ambispora leptoticha TaxID=144679 RepID=A0A9N9AZK3_9GLOM|nr:9372_t:CDS:2 [Ambispora leptoticha]